jgi:hypothetical protein
MAMIKFKKPVVVFAAIGAAIIGGASVGLAAQSSAPAPTHMAIWSVNSDGLDFQTILTGGIGDYGTAKSTVNRSVTTVALSRGSFKLSTGKLDSDFVHTVSHWPYDRATCSIHGSLTDPVPIVPGSGTGAYKGISGTFPMTITLSEDWHRVAGCNEETGFQAQLITIEGTGTVNP